MRMRNSVKTFTGKYKMNFEIDYRHIHIVRSPQALPLLLLVREWGEYGNNAFLHTDIILLILRGIQPLANFKRGLEVTEIVRSLEDAELREKFKRRFDEVVTDLTSFMNLFDEVEQLLVSSDKSTCSILDKDCSNSIIGIYVRQCVLEYRKLTFSQLMRFHSGLLDYFKRDEEGGYYDQPEHLDSSKNQSTMESSEKNFGSKLQSLVESGESGYLKDSSLVSSQAVPGRAELGTEALRLAELHGLFGHNKEGLLALEEAIRLGEQNNNSLLLEHSLAWLLKFESVGKENSLVMLKKYVENAEELQLPLLGLWGRLQQAKTRVQLHQHPKVVLGELSTSEVETMSSYDEEELKSALHIGTLSLLATTWQHYGHRMVALYYAQLICHMTSHALPQSPDERESVALAIAIVVEHFRLDLRDASSANDLLDHYIRLFRATGIPFKILIRCQAELKFDEALDMGNFTSAKVHTDTIATIDRHEGCFRSAILAMKEGDISKCVEILHDLSKSASSELKLRCLQCLAEVYSDLGKPAQAISYLAKCLVHCQNYHFPQHHFKTKLRDVVTTVTKDCSFSTL